MDAGLKIIFIFVDGLGMGSADPSQNLLCGGRYPILEKLLNKHAIPIDACLGVDGRPQSATGQATLFTGVNAAKLMGRHIEGFPPAKLKEMIRQENVFSKLQRAGKSCTFANSYWLDNITLLPPRRESVTTVMTLAALGKVRGKQKLLANRAVNHDITRWTMHTRGYTGSLITPQQAGQHLINIGNDYDFTLFEYFLTDRAGHSNDPELKTVVLDHLNQFLASVIRFAERPNRLLLLSSDHGNIEDVTTATHTQNPVPLIALGSHAEQIQHSITSLKEVTPRLIESY